MEQQFDLDTFAKILTEKGYSGYFHTQGVYAGKLRDSIADYLENCHKGADNLPKQNLLLTGYLQWSGDDKPRVTCCIWVKYVKGKFSLSNMEVQKNDRFGQLLKKSELTNLSVMTIPKAKEAIALVSEVTKQTLQNNPRLFKL